MQFELLPPVPAVVLAQQLRRIPLFGFASVDELFRISSLASQVRFDAGRVLQEAGATPEHILVLVEGSAEVQKASGWEEISPPYLFGFREVLEGVPIRDSVRAVESSVCLFLDADDFNVLLSDNIELAEGLFRMLLDARAATGPPFLKSVAESAASHLSAGESSDLKPIQKVLVLQELPIFSRATAEELLELAGIAREVSFAAGAPLFGEGDPPSMVLLLAGAVSLEAPQGGDSVVLGPGDALGVHETLAGTSMGWRAEASEPVRALQIEREDLFELLSDRVDLLQGLFGALFLLHRRDGEEAR